MYSTVKLLVSRGDFVSFKLFKKLVPLFNVFLRDDEKAMQKFLPVTGLVFRYLKANHVDFSGALPTRATYASFLLFALSIPAVLPIALHMQRGQS